SGVAIFDLDFDAILAAMYAVSISAEGDCYVCVPPDLGIEAAALGASESAAPGARESAALGTSASALTGTASAQAPLQTLHMDVWGPAHVRGQGHERYFLLVVNNYSRYTTVFPLCSKGEVTEVLIVWIRVARLQLRDRFGSDFPVLRLHSDRGGEFSSDLLRAFCRAEGICQAFTLPASPQQNGIAERRIGMVMDVARTSMIHAAAPHFLWPFAVRCVANPVEPVEVAVDSGAARGAEPAGAGPGGAEPERVDPRGAEPARVEPEGAEPGGAESGGAEPGGAEPARAESGGPPGVPSPREPLSPQQLREWYTRPFRRAAGATGPIAGGASGAAGGGAGAEAAGAASGAAGGGAGAGGTGTVGGPSGVGAAGGAGAAGLGGARTRAVPPGGAAGAGAVGGPGAGGAVGVVAGDPGAEGTNVVSAVSASAALPRPYYVPLLQQVLGLPPSLGPLPPPLLSPPPVQSQLQLPPASPLPGPSPYSGPTRGLTERREPESRPALPESRPASLVRAVSTESDSLCTASPTVTCLVATVVTDPSFESTAASTLVAELVDFAAHCRLDYATCLVAQSESASVSPPSVGGECALGTDVFEDRREEFECFAVAVPHLVSMLLAPEGDPDAPDIPVKLISCYGLFRL
ncbi:unnamed protein product, partial [Closterium sp. NIES-54]